MTIQYCSDLHLEFNENSQYLKNHPLRSNGDVLVLAGDIVPLPLINKHSWFFDFVSEQFEAVFWVPGNHEYYEFDIATKSRSFNEKIRTNVSLLNNCSVNIGSLQLIFSTLWSKISPVNETDIRQGIADFHLIKFDNGWLTIDYYNQLHREAIEFLSGALSQTPTETTIVVSHHVPTLMNYPEKYKGTILNEAFATELFDFIADAGPDYWIYGHHHQGVPTFEIGKTKLVTNQLGYVRRGEHCHFRTGEAIEI